MLNAILILLGLYFVACYAWGVYVALHLATGRPLRHLFRGRMEVHRTGREVASQRQPLVSRDREMTRFGKLDVNQGPQTTIHTTSPAQDDRAAA